MPDEAEEPEPEQAICKAWKSVEVTDEGEDWVDAYELMLYEARLVTSVEKGDGTCELPAHQEEACSFSGNVTIDYVPKINKYLGIIDLIGAGPPSPVSLNWGPLGVDCSDNKDVTVSNPATGDALVILHLKCKKCK
jgi:hypothetical protein